jgi:hypothetical protein
MGKVIRITESQLKDIVGRVLSEQTANPNFMYGQQLSPTGQGNSKNRIENIANTYSTVNKDGVIVNPKSSLNNMKWMDYVTKYKITPEEQSAAKSVIGQRKTTQDTQNQRYQNITNVFRSVDPSTLKIKSTNPKLNGMSWSDYMSTYKVGEDEVRKALAYSNSLVGKQPTDTTPLKTATNKTAPRKPDPKVLALQKSLGFTGKDLDGIMGPKTRAAMAQKPAVKRDLDAKTIPLSPKPITPATVDTSKLSKLPTIQGPQSNVSAERRQEIASNIEKQAGTGRLMYKGGDLNPEEQQFLNTYVQSLGGGEMAKSKDKEYGQKIVYKN